jgi:hypothetical protein
MIAFWTGKIRIDLDGQGIPRIHVYRVKGRTKRVADGRRAGRGDQRDERR